MAGALDGVRIVDLCRDMPGSYVCMLMGDMGAEVVKVEPVEGAPGRSEPTFHLWNRGRRSLAVDIQAPEGHAILKDLVGRSDVMIETFLASEARGLGVDFGTVSTLNPRLIYCAMPPFGESGPLADVPADDGVVSAHAGVYGEQGGQGRPPVFVHLPITSYGAAFLAAFAISSALYIRETNGEGQKVEVPWYAGAVAMQTGPMVRGPNVTYRARGVSDREGLNPVYRLYKCQDDWLFIACGNVTFWNKLCIALGIEHLVGDPRFENAPWNIPVKHWDFLSSLIGEIVGKRPRTHWLEYLAGHDVPCASVETRDSFPQHSQVKHNQMFVEMNNPVVGHTLQIGIPVNLHETPGTVGRPAPTPGQDTGEILSWLGYSAQQVEFLADRGIIKLG